MMSLKVIFLVAMVILEALTITEARVATRDIKPYGQPPLLFGRRGLNPNMNSLFFGKRSGLNTNGLFFGKRSPASSAAVNPTVDDVRNACTLLVNYLDDVERLVTDEV